MRTCVRCCDARAVIVRPKNGDRLCKTCFITVFETEIHTTIITSNLFSAGEKVAIGASGGKDSTVLACVLGKLNEKYKYGLDLVLLSIDEGITGYRDESLETVKRNSMQYGMDLTVVGYDRLYGWTMDEVVSQIGKRGNCTYCGVFRRQALDRGAAMLGVQHVVTGHNADDMAETVMMNLLRGDLPRLARSTSIITSSPTPTTSSSSSSDSPISTTSIKRSKPLKYAYEKEIVLYAHHNQLDYFSTECVYSPEAFRGSARALIKNLERVRPSAILDIIQSGENMAILVPSTPTVSDPDNSNNGAGKGNTKTRSCGTSQSCSSGLSSGKVQNHDIDHGCGASFSHTGMAEAAATSTSLETEITLSSLVLTSTTTSSHVTTTRSNSQKPIHKQVNGQVIHHCSRCGYMSSQHICKACTLVDSLNKAKAKTAISVAPS